jgi:hypothetical protein
MGKLRWIGWLSVECEKQLPFGDDNKKGKGKSNDNSRSLTG